jgi:hypothetical protein
MCYWLTEGLVARGHEVTFFAAGKDNTRAQFVQTFEDPRVIVSERRSPMFCIRWPPGALSTRSSRTSSTTTR